MKKADIRRRKAAVVQAKETSLLTGSSAPKEATPPQIRDRRGSPRLEKR